MRVIKTDLKGVIKIELESFSDHRGKYTETYIMRMLTNKQV